MLRQTPGKRNFQNIFSYCIFENNAMLDIKSSQLRYQHIIEYLNHVYKIVYKVTLR